jgi:hypothetical protein
LYIQPNQLYPASQLDEKFKVTKKKTLTSAVQGKPGMDVSTGR